MDWNSPRPSLNPSIPLSAKCSLWTHAPGAGGGGGAFLPFFFPAVNYHKKVEFVKFIG